MDPVQRIPRYTLLFRNMMKRMHPNDPQMSKLAEAEEIASRIALAETDDATKRAAVMSCLSTSIEGFPPNLFSHSRRFIECIDVEDPCTDGLLPGSVSTTAPDVLHCSLFLFDDKLMIVKRPLEKGGRSLAGLNQPEKVAMVPGRSAGVKKNTMIFKGIVDILDVVATDVGGTGKPRNYHVLSLISTFLV